MLGLILYSALHNSTHQNRKKKTMPILCQRTANCIFWKWHHVLTMTTLYRGFVLVLFCSAWCQIFDSKVALSFYKCSAKKTVNFFWQLSIHTLPSKIENIHLTLINKLFNFLASHLLLLFFTLLWNEHEMHECPCSYVWEKNFHTLYIWYKQVPVQQGRYFNNLVFFFQRTKTY